MFSITPCKEIQDILGFWIPRNGFGIPSTGFQSSFCQWTLNSGLSQNTVFHERAPWLEGGGALIGREGGSLIELGLIKFFPQ